MPDTHAYTHDGQRQMPRDRPNIRVQLTGSFTCVDQQVMQERQDVSITAEVQPSLPGPRDFGQHVELVVRSNPLNS